MTVWKQRVAGEPDTGMYDTTEELGTPSMMFADRPDWVRRPDTGARVRVVEQRIKTLVCPMCGAKIQARVLELEDGVSVIDCGQCRQFVWYRMRESPV